MGRSVTHVIYLAIMALAKGVAFHSCLLHSSNKEMLMAAGIGILSMIKQSGSHKVKLVFHSSNSLFCFVVFLKWVQKKKKDKNQNLLSLISLNSASSCLVLMPSL
eukprot:Lithocolla_globosa_v1_NODE_540_length_3787_cov_70.867631.p8 type:complete len:105 gc:universal NODE_540_length_3787_cov_70.867631:1263-949(-)